MPKLLRITTLVSMLFAALPAAQAATQSYSFLGTLNAIQFSGSFSFDDSLLTVFDFVNNPLLTVAPVASLSMTYNDVSYSHLDAWGPPDVSYHNGAFLGLSWSELRRRHLRRGSRTRVLRHVPGGSRADGSGCTSPLQASLISSGFNLTIQEMAPAGAVFLAFFSPTAPHTIFSMSDTP